MNNQGTTVAEDLMDQLQMFVDDIEEGDHDPFYDDHTVDSLCDMQEIIMAFGTGEGRKYQSLTLATNKPIKIHETVEIERVLSGDKDKVKVMAILSVNLIEGDMMIVNFLGKRLG